MTPAGRAIATFGLAGAAAIANVSEAHLRSRPDLTRGQRQALLRAAVVLSRPLTAAQLGG